MLYKLGLIGYPLSHSMSKVIQEAALESVGEKGSYELLETTQEDLINRVKYLRSSGFQGFNVTIPLKVGITLFLSSVDNIANVAGSANTIKIKEDFSLEGYNTDVYGFMEAIDKDTQAMLIGKKAIVLGNGGAARAIGVGLALLRVSHIDFYVRDLEKASDLIENMRENFPSVNVNCYKMINLETLKNYKILVNTTPLGMKNMYEGKSPISENLLKTMDSDSCVYDIVYNPLKTKLIKMAKERGLKTIQGLDMLIYQGAKSFEIWTGLKPDITKMKIAALEAMLD